MKLNELLQAIQPLEVVGDTDVDICGVDIDSRLTAPGHLFMAMRGTQADGHAYIPAALERGAVAVLCQEMPAELKPGVAYVRVADSEDATGRLATRFYGDPTSKLRLVGVTGTNGKTTVATLLYHMFRYFGYKVGLVSTVCNYIDDQPVPTEHTTPDPITLNSLLGRPVIVYQRWESILKDEASLNLVCRCEDARTAASLAQGGLGIGIMPLSAVPETPKPGMEVRILSEKSLQSEICAIRLKGRYTPVAAELFLEMLCS